MMDSNVNIDPATFQFPDPRKSSIDKGSSLLPYPKRHLGSMQLQPRSAGFIYKRELRLGNRLSESVETRGLSKQICQELVNGPPYATQTDKPPREHRKHSIKTVFSSRSKNKSSKRDNKMPIATQRTSDGRIYGHILSEQIYDYSGNASTYQVNKSRRPLATPANEGQQNNCTTSLDFDGNIVSITHQIDRTKKPERSAHSSVEDGEAKHRLSPYQTVESNNSTSVNRGKKLLTDRLVDGNTVAGRNEDTFEPLLRKSTTDDSLGLLRDLSQILSRGETTTSTAGASQIPVLEAEHQPRVRDFAAHGSAPFSRARAAIQPRSRSPVKVTGRQIQVPITPNRPLDDATCGVQAANRLGRSSNNITLPSMALKELARPFLAPPLSATQDQVLGNKTSPVINYHSKESSVVSVESTVEDIQSDASSGVVSNARSAVFVKVPPQPGPAPLTPLPSLPEGLDNSAPATPRASQSSRRLASAENSPSKVPPRKSPAQYRLYPSVDSSPPKKPGSPNGVNVAAEPEQALTRPSPPLRSKRRGFSFPRSDLLPTSMSVGTLDELEQWKDERAENTKRKKLQDLAHMRSHKKNFAEFEAVTLNTVNGERSHEGVAELPSPMDSYSSAIFPSKHRSQNSHVSNLSASTTLQHRGSSMLSQKLSPIIMVAEQEPTSPVDRASSPKSNLSKNNNTGEHPRGFKTNGCYPVPPYLASHNLQEPENERKARPVSSHSLPVPRPVASKVHHTSMQEMSDLEARLSAMERKNAMLEKAFLAVLDTSAGFGGYLGRNGMEGTRGDTSSRLSGRNGDRSQRTSRIESLYAGLETDGVPPVANSG